MTWTWRRLATVGLFIGGGVACALIPGAQAFAAPLLTLGVGLAAGIQLPTPTTKGK